MFTPCRCELFISPPLCGQLLMPPRPFKNLSASVLRLAVLPHILPAPALSADSVIPSSSPVTIAVLSTLPVSPTGQLIHFIVCCLCRSTLGGAFLPWTGCVWAYLLERWATPPSNHTGFLLASLKWLCCWCCPLHTHTHWADCQLPIKTKPKQLQCWFIDIFLCLCFVGLWFTVDPPTTTHQLIYCVHFWVIISQKFCCWDKSVQRNVRLPISLVWH